MQLDDRTIDRIHASIDGELAPDHQRELDALLASSPEAAALHEELRRLDDWLTADAGPEMPRTLSERIIQEVGDAAGRPSLLTSLFAPFRPAAVGLAFAAGLLLTVSVYEWIPAEGAGMDPSALSGALVRAPAAGTAPGLDAFDIEYPGLSGRAVLERGPDGLLLSLDLATDQALDALILPGEGGQGIGGIVAGEGSGPLRGVTFDTSGGKLSVSGRQVITVILPDDPAYRVAPRTITVTFFRQGKPVHTGTLSG